MHCNKNKKQKLIRRSLLKGLIYHKEIEKTSVLNIKLHLKWQHQSKDYKKKEKVTDKQARPKDMDKGYMHTYG